jgi:hypothetical protein
MRAQNRRRKKNRIEREKKRKITKLCLFLDLLSRMRTNMYVIHHHKKREREVEHVTVLKTTTQMREKKEKKNKRETMLNVYELTIFMLLCSKKRIKKKSTSEHWYWHHYQRINKSKERTKIKRRRLHLFPGNAMSLPRKKKKHY